ncbi:hypothetical protein BGZ81_005976 [Podila clonocystis]|nr:hypothetical protein BGZ81_005976 [Podila clonocystis]
MPLLRRHKAITLQLLALTTFASFFYLKIYFNVIDPGTATGRHQGSVSAHLPDQISDNNARFAELNLRAFHKFCHGRADRRSRGGVDSGEDVVQSSFAAADGAKNNAKPEGETRLDEDFKTYEEWIDYIRQKNTGQSQDQSPETSYQVQSHRHHQQPQQQQELLDPTDHQRAQQPYSRVQYLKRPLSGWIMNYSAILEPCNRKVHTSAHCLDYLAKDHLYLVPPRKVHMPPNKPYSTAATSPVSGSPLTAHSEFDASNNDDKEDDRFKIESGLSDQAAETATPPMHFHMFWRAPITDKLLLAVNAFLFTQPLDRSRLHLWIDSTDLPGGRAEDYRKNPFVRNLVLRPMNRFIRIHQWDHKAQEAYAYPPSSQNSANATGATSATITTTTNITPVAFSDEVRFLILYRYGGMYLDADTLLLRDMSPIYDTGLEFAYEWSNLKIYNTAIMKLDMGSAVARRILDGAKVREQDIRAKKEQQQQQQDRGEGKEVTGVHGKRTLGEEQAKKNTGEKSLHGGDKSSTLLSRRSSPDSSILVQPIEPPERTPDEMCPDEIYHPDRIRHYLRQDGALENNGLVMMPVPIFDPLWLRFDGVESLSALANDPEQMMEDLKTFPEVFTNPEAVCPGQYDWYRQQQQGMQEHENTYARGKEDQEEAKEGEGFPAGPEVFFMGAYAYHWHNSWLTSVEPQSWMGRMRLAYDEFLAGERPNLYGEWWF